MFVQIGADYFLKDKDIIGIFDLDNTTVQKSTREYINNISKQGREETVSFKSLPKSFIVTEKNGEDKIYISPYNTSTIFKHLNDKK
ncbi:MAG: DUF370 domain-containing protein [Clostridia bacterium]|nr:DUF370 domain-containing protein [Clostridia bacterium]